MALLALVGAGPGIACAGAGAPLTGRGSGADADGGLRGEAVVIGDFSEVTGIAVGARTVFVASRSGLAMFDRLFGRWSPPVFLGRLPERSAVLAADPAANAVWIGGAGEIIHYDASLDRATRAYLPGTVDAILFDRRDPARGAFVHGGSGWQRVTPAGLATPVGSGDALPPPAARMMAPSLAQLYRDYPTLRAFGSLLVRDVSLRPAPITSGARAPERDELWIGTGGNGVFRVDPTFQQATPVRYGLRGERARSLALAADGVWIASNGSAFSGGAALTFASEDLQSWHWLGSDAIRELRGAAVHDIVVRERTAWIATSRGVVHVTLPDGRGARVWSAMHGLPVDEALTVEATASGAWVGTSRGLAFVAASDSGARTARVDDVSEAALPGVPVRALRRVGGTLWVGTDAGLFTVPLDGDAAPTPRRAERPSLFGDEVRLRRAVIALASTDSVLFATTADALLEVHLRTGMVRLAADAAQLATIGTPTSLAANARTVWIGGRRGALVLDRETGARRLIRGLPVAGGIVRDVLLGASHAWLATDEGLVRLRLAADGGAP